MRVCPLKCAAASAVSSYYQQIDPFRQDGGEAVGMELITDEMNTVVISHNPLSEKKKKRPRLSF